MDVKNRLRARVYRRSKTKSGKIKNNRKTGKTEHYRSLLVVCRAYFVRLYDIHIHCIPDGGTEERARAQLPDLRQGGGSPRRAACASELTEEV